MALAEECRTIRGLMATRLDPKQALEVAERAALEAGALALEGWRSGGAISHKGKFDLLTEYDLASEELVRKVLTDAYPDHRIVGEEGAETGDGDLVWYLDPIDGTTNFAHGHPFFCVSLALYDGSEGLAGVVHAPALGVTWTASKGDGAKRNDEPCRVSRRGTLSEALCATGFAYDRRTNPDNNLAEIAFFLQHVRGIRRCGSAAIDLCLVAEGTYDLYWERHLNAWDMCAGALIVSEAGGQISDYEGRRADPRTGRLIASNGLFHQDAVHTIREARRQR